MVGWLSSSEICTGVQVQILDKAAKISLCTNTLAKGMYSTILPLAMDKY